MTATLKELEGWLSEPEGERLEFKEAKANFHFETLAKYCAALANEGGGKIILGVTDRRPRRVVGSTAFDEPEERLPASLTGLGSKSGPRRFCIRTAECWYSMFHPAQWACQSNMTACSGPEPATSCDRFHRIDSVECSRKQARTSRLNCIPTPASTIWIRL